MRRTCGWAVAFLASVGCASGIRSGATVVAAAKSCPEVTGFVAKTGGDWTATLGIDSGDAATLKAALGAAAQLEAQTTEVVEKLKTACTGLAADLAMPLAASGTEDPCQRASQAASAAKAQLGQQTSLVAERLNQCTPSCSSPCDASAPKGPCAQSTIAVHVTGAADLEAAARYSKAMETYLPTILATLEAEGDARAFVSSARTSIELGIVTERPSPTVTSHPLQRPLFAFCRRCSPRKHT